MRYDVITAFDTCVDLVVDLGETIPEFDQKEKLVDSFSLEMGGSSCIFACQCAKLGLKTTGIGVIGEDAFGRVVIDGLSESGVDTSYVKSDATFKTGLGVLLTRNTDRAILTYSGTIGATGPELFTNQLLTDSRHLHIGSYYLLTGLINAFPDILRRAKEFGLTTSLDTNWDPLEKWELPDEVISNLNIFLPNENEAMYITGSRDVIEAARQLAERIPIVVIKQGEKGGIVVSGNQLIHLTPIDVQVIDTVGAGDSFDAGFIWAYLNGMDLKDCLHSGLYCGSMNTAKTGGTKGQARLSELKKHLSKIKCTSQILQ